MLNELQRYTLNELVGNAMETILEEQNLNMGTKCIYIIRVFKEVPFETFYATINRLYSLNDLSKPAFNLEFINALITLHLIFFGIWKEF